MSNPYTADAAQLLRNAEMAHVPELAGHYLSAAQIKATLALAHEQRTRSLIALWALSGDQCNGLSRSAGLERDHWRAIAEEIKERLEL